MRNTLITAGLIKRLPIKNSHYHPSFGVHNSFVSSSFAGIGK